MTDCLMYIEDKVKRTKSEYLSAYMANYRKNKPDNWYKKNVCEICGGSYINSCKSRHFSTTKHQFALLKINYENIKNR